MTNEQTRYQRTTASGKDNWRNAFLSALAKIPNVTYACAQAKVSRDMVYKRRKKDPRFAAKWDSAIDQGVETLETSMWTRATFGRQENVWMKDEHGKPIVVDTITKFDTTAAIFMLKAHRPALYRERLLLSSPDGEALRVETSPLFVDAMNKVYGTEAQPPVLPLPL